MYLYSCSQAGAVCRLKYCCTRGIAVAVQFLDKFRIQHNLRALYTSLEVVLGMKRPLKFRILMTT